MITPEKLDSWRIVPRLLILAYMVVFYQTCNWFMDLPLPNNAQAGFVSNHVKIRRNDGNVAKSCDRPEVLADHFDKNTMGN